MSKLLALYKKRPITQVRKSLCSGLIVLLFIFYSKSAFSQVGTHSQYTDSLPRVYLQLQAFHQQYSKIVSQHNWTYFPADTVLRKGDISDLVYGLRSNLILTGDLAAQDDYATNILDSLLAKAIVKFQIRHGLAADGVFGNATIAASNVAISKRADQIAVNIDRWRTFSQPARQPYIFVNIPDFSLQVIDKDTAALKMKVIVGKKSTKTVEMQRELKYIVLNPSWKVPKGIAAKEILPLQQKNPAYLTQHRMRLYSQQNGQRTEVNPDSLNWQAMTPANFHYLIEQVPGEVNALGKVKFVFPNEHDIYLHDTSQRSLFNKRVRALSHGCVRVEKPVELAAYLLKNDPDWRVKRIKEFIANNSESVGIRLRSPVPIIIAYFTAWVDENAQLHFRDDVYDYDQQAGIEIPGSVFSKVYEQK
jgi:murein L,D-transpeptidase YcbB/YkuD